MSALIGAGDLAHSRTRVFGRRVEAARRLIHEAAAHDDLPWCIAFSGGKDSTVLLHLVERERPGLAVAWLDDGWDYPEAIEFVDATEQRLGRRILRVHVPTESPYAAPAENLFWSEMGDPGFDPAVAHPEDMGFEEWRTGYHGYTGVREQESNTRRLHLRTHGALYYSRPWGHWVCCPLAEWRVDDVWAYIAAYDLPVNPVYARLGALGVRRDMQRVNSIVSATGLRFGSMSWLRMGWPALYRRFVAHTDINGGML
jgi:phosphoadenosine phosphosulfate reductase